MVSAVAQFACALLIMLMSSAHASAAEGDSLHPMLLVTRFAGSGISYVDPAVGVIGEVETGPAPFGIAADQTGRAFVSTAEGVAVIDVAARRKVDLIPYGESIGPVSFGEYRAGGMGLTVNADGSRVYVGLHLPGREDRLEVIDTEKRTVVASYPVGTRPFDLLLSSNEQQVYSIDHDDYSVTQIDLTSGKLIRHKVAPLGHAPFGKPHYAVFGPDGALLMPVQGRVLVSLNSVTAEQSHLSLTAETHQHGVAIDRSGEWLAIVGTGSAGSARRGPSLTLLNLVSGNERIIPLERTHENVVLGQKQQYAYLSGGQSFTGGWNGITILDLQSGSSRTIAVPEQPFDLIAVSRTPKGR